MKETVSLLALLRAWAWTIVPAAIALGLVFSGNFDSLSAQPTSPPSDRADPSTFRAGTLDTAAVASARTFSEFPILWLGEEFQGFKLTAFIRENYSIPPEQTGYPRDLGRNTVSLIYGACEPEKTEEVASCVAPISIIIWAPGAGPKPDEVGDPEWRAQQGPPDSIRGLTSRVVGGSPLIWAENGITLTVHSNGTVREQALQALELANPAQVGLPDIGAGDSLMPLSNWR